MDRPNEKGYPHGKEFSMFTANAPLVLASGSPRRQQFMKDIDLAFTIDIPDIIEPRPEAQEQPIAYALRTAAVKANHIAKRHAQAVIIAADTIVIIDEAILGKPKDEAESLSMLTTLAGRTHSVVTAVQLCFPKGKQIGFYCESKVTFHPWAEEVLAAYARSGESLDKAGGYAVQGLGSFLVDSIEGSWTNVVGLPVAELLDVLIKERIITAR